MDIIFNKIKEAIKEFITKKYIIVMCIIFITSIIMSYIYLPIFINNGIQQKKEYDKKHHLGWYSYNLIIKSNKKEKI